MSRLLAVTVALAFASSCALILHPERKGNNSTPLDTVPLVVDILLFLPGIIPGVIAMVLDFGTGAIYLEKSGSSKPFLARRPGDPTEASLEVRLVDDASGEVLERAEVTVVAPTAPGQPVALALPELDGARWAGRATRVEIASETGETISLASL